MAGTINIRVFRLKGGQTLDEFAQWWHDSLTQEARKWALFEMRSFMHIATFHEGYLLDYLRQETGDKCVSGASDLLVESHHFPKALVLSANVCSSAEQSVFREIRAMEFIY